MCTMSTYFLKSSKGSKLFQKVLFKIGWAVLGNRGKTLLAHRKKQENIGAFQNIQWHGHA